MASFLLSVRGVGGIVKKASEHCISNHPSQPPVSADNFRNKLFYQASDKNLSFLGKNDTGNQRLFKNHTHTRDLPKVACVPGRTDRPLIGQEIGFYRVPQTPGFQPLDYVFIFLLMKHDLFAGTKKKKKKSNLFI